MILDDNKFDDLDNITDIINTTSIKHISIANNNISSHLSIFFNKLSYNNFIESLNVSNIFVCNYTVGKIVKFVNNNKSLIHLNLDGCIIKNLQVLADSIINNK